MRALSFFIFLSMLFPRAAWSSSCCGGTTAFPELITGIQQALITTSYSYSNVQASALPEFDGPRYFSDQEQMETTTLFLGASYLLAERWQVASSIPFQWTSTQFPSGLSESDARLQDSSLQVSYELFDGWSHLPRSFLGVRLTLPTGRSVFEAQSQSKIVDSSGYAMWALGLHYQAIEEVGLWDFLAGMSADYYFPETFESGVHSAGFWASSGLVGAGRSFHRGKSRLGLSLRPYHRQSRSIDLSQSRSTQDSFETFVDASLAFSHMMSDHYSVSVIATDQTLAPGWSHNTTLARTLTLRLQRSINP